MKRFFATILILTLVLTAFAGCGGQAGVSQPEAPAAQSEPAEQAPQPEASNFNESREITVVSREEGSGTRGAFIELLGIQVRGDDGSSVDTTTKEAVIADGTDIVLTNVANDVYAIGYISTGSLNDTIKALDIDGAAPTVENIKSGAYPVSRPFNIAYKGQPDGLAADFIDFIFSKDGQDVVDGRGYITVVDNPAYSGDRPSGKLVISGSSSVFPLMERLVEAYQKINEGADIEVHLTDSSAGMQAAIDGTCDIGMASRDLRDAEMAELNHQAIAIDGIAVIVNQDNPSEALTSEQVKDIFTGEITAWSGAK
ncbi:MAG: substrate-binding domain-containing protein [Oscillospiraceae bacterium]|nr:substrate-binding domain-containing protein [Oscillospiraceae bacterium]